MVDLTGETTLRIIQNAPIEKEQNDLCSFWTVLKKSDLSDKTIIAYQHDLKLFLKWLFDINPSRTMSSLSEIDIIEYRQQLLGQGLKAATINRRLGSIQRLCRWAFSKGHIKEDVSTAIKQVNIVSKRSPSGLKRSEVQRLLQVAGQSSHGHSKRNYALLHIMLQTGLRVNEVAELKLSDLDLNERSGKVCVHLGKGRKTRDIPLNSKVRRALSLYLGVRLSDDTIENVFLSERNTPLAVRTIQVIIKTLAHRAGITRINVSPHTLRHTFAINYLKTNPTNIVELANLLGHESLDTTAIYTHPSLEDLAENLERMAMI